MIHLSQAAADAARVLRAATPAPPSLVARACTYLVAQRQQQGEGNFTEATFETELTMLRHMPETPADACALIVVALNVIDRNEGCEGSEAIARETVAAMRAIRRSAALLAAETGVNFAQVLSGFYVAEFRDAVLAP